MATYPLKNIAIGSDTYEIKSSGYNTLKVTGSIAPYKFNNTNLASGITCTDADGNSITVSDLMKARYTTPVKVLYYISDDNNYLTYDVKFEHTSASSVSIVASIRRLDNNNVDTKQVALPTIYINCTGSDSTNWSIQSASGILLEPITTLNVKISNNFNTVADFVNDVLAGTTPTYGISLFTFYKTDIDTLWSSNNDVQKGNIDFGICLPTPKATFKAVSKWVDNNDYYFIINVYTTYTVGSDTHVGLVPLLGKIVFTTGSNQKISGFTFERIYTAND